MQYAASFGVEVTAFNMVALYYSEVFNVSDVKAGNVALLAGITNIFARAMVRALLYILQSAVFSLS